MSVFTMTKKVFGTIATALTLCITLLLGACSSGDDSDAGIDSLVPGGGGTGQQVPVLVIGPISGFGSVIVNGIRYTDSAAIFQTELGNSLSSSELRLGMMVEVRGASYTTWGVADTITAYSELKGIVDGVNGNSIMVNGVQVALVDSTIYDEANTLVIGDQVEVYGVYDVGRSAVIATRIERKSLADFKLRGVVTALDADAEQFSLGSQRVSYSGAGLPADFGNGVSVRVYSNSAPDGGVWPVTRVRLAGVGSSGSSDSNSGDRIEIEGVVSQYNGGQLFVVNGFEVNTSSANFSDGAASDLAVGRLVEVKGTIDAGMLIAESVEFEDGSGSSSGEDTDSSFEVTGTITRFQAISDFTVRNVVIDASQATRFDDGSVADLSAGACVEVRGGLVNSSAGSVLLASRIKFEDDC